MSKRTAWLVGAALALLAVALLLYGLAVGGEDDDPPPGSALVVVCEAFADEAAWQALDPEDILTDEGQQVVHAANELAEYGMGGTEWMTFAQTAYDTNACEDIR